MFELIVDSNVVIAAMLKNGLSRKLLLCGKLKVFAPDLLELEVMKYKEKIIAETHILPYQFLVIKDLVFSTMEVIPFKEYSHLENEAKSFSPDQDDWPFFASSIYKQRPLWSNEKKLKKQNNIYVFTTSEVLEMLKQLQSS